MRSLFATLAVSCASANFFAELNSENFSKVGSLMKGMVKSQINSIMDVEGLGAVSFSQCSDQGQIFHLDISKTFTDPKFIKKGEDLKINLAGTVDGEMTVKSVHVNI